uniref:Odorant binding protein 13 n=1 Tax=Mythimna separata TaxID=271217 RepID=A0A1V1WCB4_MYTSE
MCLINYHVLILCLILVESYALNCRSSGGPKEAELKNIYKKCLKMQEGKNSSRGNSEQDYKEPRGQIQRSDWERGRTTGSKENKNGRDDRMSGKDRKGGSSMRDRDDMMGRSDDRMDRNDERSNRNDDRMSNNDRSGGRGRMGGNNNRNDMSRGRDDRFGNYNGKEDFPQSNEYGGHEMPGQGQYNNYYSTTPAPRRYKRERRPENSGQRSQYNPNNHKITGYEDSFRSDEKNTTENSSKETDNNACALHCFLENLEMTAEDGMPDRYLVTHAITKDVKDEDLRDFLQESIEECFQILDNENTEDKCEFSKNLLICLSEKGRANCDDWKDDLKF